MTLIIITILFLSHHSSFGIVLKEQADAKRQSDYRTYRAEKTYAVAEGKWYFLENISLKLHVIMFMRLWDRYYEAEVLTSGPMRVGWARVDCKVGRKNTQRLFPLYS